MKPEVKNEITTHQDNLLELSRHLEECLSFVNSVSDPTFGGIKMRMRKHLQQDIAFISVQTGNVVNIVSHDELLSTNPLIGTNVVHKIMGKEVGKSRRPINEKKLTIKPTDQARFQTNVESLYKGFLSLKDKDVIETLSEKGNDIVLRGVAKMAGVKDWETCELDVVLFADIRSGIKAKAQGKSAIESTLDSEEESEEEFTEI